MVFSQEGEQLAQPETPETPEQPEQAEEEEIDEEEFALIHVQTISDSVYRFRIKSEGSTFQMKICKSGLCKDPVEYLKAMNPDTFVYAVMVNLNKEFSKNLVLADLTVTKEEEPLEVILKNVKVYDEKEVRKKLTEVQNVLRTIETAKDNYSGVLVLNIKKDIPYQVTNYIVKSKKLEEKLVEELNSTQKSLVEADRKILDSLDEKSASMQYLQLISKKGIKAFVEDEQIIKKNFKNPKSVYYKILSESNQYEKFDYHDYESVTSNGTKSLRVISATVQFFNNKAATIRIKAQLTKDGKTDDLSFINSDYSVPIRYFNKYGSTVSALLEGKGISGRRNLITIDFNDVFDFDSFGSTFSSSVANCKVELKLEPNKNSHIKKIPERRFFDFFSGIIYSDLMGFNTESSNSLANAQARILLPLNLRNAGKYSVIRQLTAVANIALQNSFEDENRFININDSEKFNNFDLLRKNNLYGKLSLEVFTHEAKGFFTNIGIGYSAGFYRTGFKLTQTEDVEPDVTLSKQLLSIGHGPYLNFEIRPQSNFGADVTFSLEDLNYAGENSISGKSFSNDIITNKGKDHFVMPYNLINLEANFYWLTNPETSVGGVYAKLGAYFHTDTNSIFPQFMVGYATNLTSFVDKFKSSKPDEIEEAIKVD